MLKQILYSLLVLFGLLFTKSTKAQLSGVYAVPGTFTSVAAAVTALNWSVTAGPVIIDIAAGYTETAIPGGFTLVATGTSAKPITFQKSGTGPNPVIIAYSGGTNTPATPMQDGVWRLVGSDYITFDGIDILDPNTSNPSTMEFGYGLFKTNILNGCQNNTIKNCTISLNKINNASYSSFSSPAREGSRGIDVINAAVSNHTYSPLLTSAAGPNSNNKFYSNTIKNCNIGISLVGDYPVSPYTTADFNNDVGGSSILTGNTFIDYGGAPSAINPSSAVSALYQMDFNVSFNIVNNNTGPGVNHTRELNGIFVSNPPYSNCTINSNTVTLHGGGTTSSICPIQNRLYTGGYSTNTVNINNNLISNCTYSTSTSGSFYGIYSYNEQDALNINNNVFTNNSTGATSGYYSCITSAAVSWSKVNINNNAINNLSLTASSNSVVFYGILGTGTGTLCSLTINSNSLQSIYFGGPMSTEFTFIHNIASPPSTFININFNQMTNLSGIARKK